jgi:hypothetical protein
MFNYIRSIRRLASSVEFEDEFVSGAGEVLCELRLSVYGDTQKRGVRFSCRHVDHVGDGEVVVYQGLLRTCEG